MVDKGIILSGGLGSRLYPTTHHINKQLLPVYDKPMVYYPLCTLMKNKIKDILIVTNQESTALYQKLLGDGFQFGINIQYAVQEKPKGIGEAFIIGEEFIGNDDVALILGDNIFHGDIEFDWDGEGAVVFAYYVKNPDRYGVVQFGRHNDPINIVEKPDKYIGNYAVTGLYIYDNKVIEYAKGLQPSVRDELEITDINKRYLDSKKLKVIKLKQGVAWLDSGTHEDLLNASNYVKTIEERQGIKIGCPEEIAYKNGWIDDLQLEHAWLFHSKTAYGDYLGSLFDVLPPLNQRL